MNILEATLYQIIDVKWTNNVFHYCKESDIDSFFSFRGSMIVLPANHISGKYVPYMPQI